MMSSSFIPPPVGGLMLSWLLVASASSVLTDGTRTNTPSSSDYTQSSARKFLETSRHFDAWLTQHSRSYPDPAEYRRRLSVFAANLDAVERHNAAYERGYTTFAMSVDGPFADLTDAEFSALYLMEGQNCSATHTSSGPVPDGYSGDDMPTIGSALSRLPKAVDWRTQGVVTPIKNQGHCGSCWTFSTSATLESHHCIAHSNDCTHWKGLAEQQLLDCAGDFNNHGCDGGLPSQAFEYIRYSGGMALEESYKYKAQDGTCREIDRRDIGARIRAVHNISAGDEDGIVKAVARHGPVAVAFDVSPDFRLYSHGVYDSFNATTNQTMCLTDSQHINHAVVAVGYGETMEDKPVPYHIIRNSWG
jgi:cathepsin H